MNLKAALDVLVASTEMDAKSLMSKTGEQTPASDALWTIAAKLRKLSAQTASVSDTPPPFDSQEEAQRAAGAMLSEAAAAFNAFAEQLAAPDPELVGQKMQGLGGRIAAVSPALGAPYAVGVDPAHGPDAMAYILRSARKPIDFKNHQWIGIAIDHATKWKTAGGLQNLLMAKHYLDKLIELEGKAA